MNDDAGQALLDELLEKTSRTFALSIPVLPQPTRLEVTVAYLLFRIADTLEDATRWEPRRKLAALGEMAGVVKEPSLPRARALAARWLEAPPCDHDGYRELLGQLPAVLEAALELSAPAFRLVQHHTLRTIERMAGFVARGADRDALQLRDTEEVRAYCYAVAGIVGEMLTELFLLGREERLGSIAPFLRDRAATFGEALQLVNILKDSATDATEGRRYLPAGADRREFFTLARRDLAVAGEYVLSLQRAGAPRGLVEFTALPVLLAWATLERVEQAGPGAKLTRAEVAGIVRRLDASLRQGRPAVPVESLSEMR
jgi:farnesyl-diphosphate farnesyltransferase